ncbi:MAG: VCBS domain-containing protein, partial [Zoogloea sp.]|uniref:beta strand repeat-containing protein n=1 Tax=Zoogloea sp. TaxID=49181 RepID=UPI00261333C3
ATEGGSFGWTYEVANSATQYLAAGETATEVFTVTVGDGEGGTVEQTVTVTITGTNDAPTIVALSTDSTGDVTEDTAVDALSGKLSTTGSIAFNDIDLIDTHTGMVVADAANTLGGTLTLSAVSEDAATEGGSFGWTYEVANSATQYLAAGETATEVFTVTVGDGEGGTLEQTVTVTITGTNDAPTIVALSTDSTGDVTEDSAVDALSGKLSTTGSIAFNDIDLIDTHTGTVAADVANTLGGTLTLSAVSEDAATEGGSFGWTYEVANSATQYLAAGETATEVFTVTVGDGEGGTLEQTVTVTITGTNDAPTIVALSTDSTGDVTEDSAVDALSGKLSTTGSIAFNDIDLIDTHTGTVVADAANTLGGTLTLSAVSEDAATEGGSFGWTYEVANSATQYLAAGETATEVFTVTVGDGEGGTVEQTVTVTITGTNDAPTIVALSTDSTGDVTEDTAVDALSGKLSTTGSIAFNDIDLIDTHTGMVVADAANTLGGTLTLSAVSEDAATEGGSFGWTYEVANSATQYLAAGETATEVFTVTVGDGEGGTLEQTVTVTITGTNDAPTIVALSTDSTGDVTEDSAVDALSGKLSTTGSIAFNDIDLIDTHTGTVAADVANTLGGTLTLSAVSEDAATEGGSFGWTYEVANSATQYLAAGETATEVFTVTVGDGEGGTLEQTVTVTITGTNDAPTIVALSTDSTGDVTEDSAVDALSGKLSTTGSIAFNDIDLIDTHTGTVVADAANTLGGTLTLSAVSEDAATEGGSFGWTYEVANSATQYLAAGETATEVFTVTVGDGEGGTLEQTVTVTITGTNDAPVLTADEATARERGGAANALAGSDGVGDVLANDTDVDLADTLNVVEITALTGVGSATAVASNSTSSVGYIEVDGAYGTLRIGADGSYRYLIDESNSEVQALRTAANTLNDVFEYRVTDGIAQVASTLTITVEGANDAPTQIHLSNTALTEITGANAITASVVDVGALSTDDVDDGESFTYDIIGGTQQFYFQIASVEGVPTLQLKAGVPLNAEFLSAYSVVVRSTDALGLSTFQTFVVDIDDVNEFQVTTPVFDVEAMDVGIAPNTVPENTAVDTFIGVTASASDADASNNAITYSLVGSLAGAAYTANEFKIDAATGQISVAGPINREVGGDARTVYVKALSADGSSKIGTLQVFISDVNEFAVTAPTDINAATNVVAENAALDTRVGITARAVDGDATTNTVSYALVDAEGAAYAGTEFEIDAVTGIVTVAGGIDREAGATRTLYVQATSADGSTLQQSFTVDVTDLNDNAPVFTSGASGSVAENAATSTVIYTAQATDADATAANNSVTYALAAGGDAALLDIDASTGAVTLKASADYETKSSYSFTVQALDGAHTTTRAVTVNVGNVDEAATGTLTVSGVAAQGGVLTASLSASDVDGAITSVAYQWQERVSGNWEDIPGDTGATLELGNDQDVVGRVGRVVVTTTDALGGTTVFRSGAVTIANVNDAPTGQPAISGTVSQGETLTASAGTLVDPDGLGVISYQWLADGAVIGGANGTTLVLGEAQVGKEISVVASYTDGFGQAESVTGIRTAAVRNVNDAPTGGLSIAGTAIQNATLSAVSTLADADGLGTVTYKWMSGATQLGSGSSYTLAADDVGRSIYVVASWTDGHGSAESVSSAATGVVANVNDVPTGSLGISGSAEDGQTLSAVSTLADVDGMGTLAYQWLADGVAISGATGSSFVLTPGQVGKAITVQARWVDGQGSTEQVTSSATGKVNAVSTAGEGNAPSIGGGTAGDGNGDGVADAIQSAVASSAVSVTTGGTTTSSYVTLVADSTAGKVADDSTNTVTSFNQTATASYMPTNSDTPLGSLNFSASTGTVSGLETFSLYVDKNLGINGYWVTNSEGTLVNLASEAYGGRMVVDGDRLRLDFQVADGSALDHDGSADGSIQVDGAVGYVPLSLISYTPDAPTDQANTQIWD